MALEQSHSVRASREVRDHFGDLLGVFRKLGEEAEPVVFGAQRKPEAVIVSYERWQGVLEAMDDVVSAVEVIERDRVDRGERLTFDELAKAVGFDPKDFEDQ